MHTPAIYNQWMTCQKNRALERKLSEFWDLEAIGIQPQTRQKEKVNKCEDSPYDAKLPKRKCHRTLPFNYTLCVRIYKSLTQRLNQTNSFRNRMPPYRIKWTRGPNLTPKQYALSTTSPINSIYVPQACVKQTYKVFQNFVPIFSALKFHKLLFCNTKHVIHCSLNID